MRMNSTFYVPRSTQHERGGFTILELLVFSAIFSIVAITFISILLSVTRVQLRETASAEVNQQSQFIMQTLQRYIEESSIIETPPDQSTSTLQLRINPSADSEASFALTEIFLDNNTGRIYLVPKEGDIPEPISSDRVVVTDLTFMKHTYPGAHDSVDVDLTLNFKSSNPQKQFQQFLQTTVARVNAATFDSNLNPTTSSLLEIGNAQQWKSINNVINFNGGNLGIHAAATNPLVVNIGTDYGLFLGSGSGEYEFQHQVSFWGPTIINGSNGGYLRFNGSFNPNCAVANDAGNIKFNNAAVDVIEICMDPGTGLGWYSLYAP